MLNFSQNDNEKIKQLHLTYTNEIPDFIKEICESEEIIRIDNVGQNCGRDYISSKIQDFTYNYTRKTHSVGVALLVWRFTQNIKMSISGLLHDIATPCFAHVIDFYNNDAETQTSTEERTRKIIANSKSITKVLNKYNLTVDDVCDYSKYPIADNEKPKLSADRLEYICYTATSMKKCSMDEIKEIIDNIVIVKNEEYVDEMCFKDFRIAEKFTKIALECNKFMAGGLSTITNQMLADTLKLAVSKNIIKYEDFYTKKELDIVNILNNCEDKDVTKYWKTLTNYTTIYESEEQLIGKYSIKVNVKIRYIDPLCLDTNKNIKRVSDINDNIKKDIENFKNSGNIKYYSVDFI